MKNLCVGVALLAAGSAFAQNSDNTERNLSVPDAVPACMERDGPNCVLPGDGLRRRVVTSPVVVVPPVVPPSQVPSAESSGAVSLSPTAPAGGLTGSGTTVVVNPNGSSNPTSSGFTTNPNSIGGNLQSNSVTTGGTSTSSGFTTNPNSVGGALNSGPASTPNTATTGAGRVRR